MKMLLFYIRNIRNILLSYDFNDILKLLHEILISRITLLKKMTIFKIIILKYKKNNIYYL